MTANEPSPDPEPPAPPDPEPAPKTAYVAFSAEIDVTTAEQLINTMMNCAGQGYEEVHLLLSTPGGSVMYGINIYNVLRAMPYRLITHNVGNVDSIGNAIFLAGDQRFACEHSTFMFHGVGFSGDGQQFNAKSAKERLDALIADEARIASVVSDRSNLTTNEVRNFYEEARTMTAHEAAAAGIVHDVKDAVIPAGADVATLVFNR